MIYLHRLSDAVLGVIGCCVLFIWLIVFLIAEAKENKKCNDVDS